MKAVNGKRTARVVMVLGTTALLAAGVLRRDRLIEEYYLWKLGSKDGVERDFAAKKLGELRSVKAIPRLLALLQGDPDPAQGLVLVMENWPGEIPALDLPPLGAALADIGLPAVPALLDQLQRAGPRSVSWPSCILLKMGTPIVPALEAKLNDPDEGLRSCAAHVLGQISSPEGRESLERSQQYFVQEDYPHAREEAERALQANPWNWQANHAMALAVLLLKDPPAAIRYLERAERMRPGYALILYNLACAHALNGDTEKSLDRLQASLDAGFADHQHLLEDPDLNSLRETERYRRLLSRLSPEPEDGKER